MDEVPIELASLSWTARSRIAPADDELERFRQHPSYRLAYGFFSCGRTFEVPR